MLRLLNGREGCCASFSHYEKPFLYQPGTCDMANVVDCDFSPDENERKAALRRWELFIEGAEPTAQDDEQNHLRMQPEYYINRYGSKEVYADYEASFLPYAFVTADGEFHSCAHMGWWGMDDGTADSMSAYREAFNAYLEQAKRDNLKIAILDLHI